MISPMYQAIRDAGKSDVTFGSPTGSLFEPTLAWLEHLRQADLQSDNIDEI